MQVFYLGLDTRDGETFRFYIGDKYYHVTWEVWETMFGISLQNDDPCVTDQDHHIL